jgi:hypothetical protein
MTVQWIESKLYFQVLQLEKYLCKPFPWTELDLDRELRERNTVGQLCFDDRGGIIGYSVYELYPKRIIIRKLVGANELALKELLYELLKRKRIYLYIQVRETDLPMQLFLKKEGFTCISMVDEGFTDSGEAGYVFEHALKGGNVSAVGAKSCGVSEVRENGAV